MKNFLKDIITKQNDWVELRYHKKENNDITVSNGRVDESQSRSRSGIAARVLMDGCWGFASTDNLTVKGIEKAIDSAKNCARKLATVKKNKIQLLPQIVLTNNDYILDGYDNLKNTPLAEKMARTIDLDNQLTVLSNKISSSLSIYGELYEEKAIVTTDGACASMKLARAWIFLKAIAEKNGEQATNSNACGVTNDWNTLFSHPRAECLVEKTGKTAVDLLSASYIEGGKQTVILGPAIVGLLIHEAIGHTVEADFVQAGSVAAGKIGQQVASKLVTLGDSGFSEYAPNAGGTIIFDDEGVPCKNTLIVENGILKSYLHNRESAAHFGVEPTGNARAWEYSDEPIIRMSNTYIAPGKQKLEDIIASTKHGYLVESSGPKGGSDSAGEFTFGAGYATEIKNGKLGKLVREHTISGIAFDVLKTVDAVSNDFDWGLCGPGGCGKIQTAKVDGGGPHIRCKITIGGRKK